MVGFIEADIISEPFLHNYAYTWDLKLSQGFIIHIDVTATIFNFFSFTKYTKA